MKKQDMRWLMVAIFLGAISLLQTSCEDDPPVRRWYEDEGDWLNAGEETGGGNFRSFRYDRWKFTTNNADSCDIVVTSDSDIDLVVRTIYDAAAPASSFWTPRNRFFNKSLDAGTYYMFIGTVSRRKTQGRDYSFELFGDLCGDPELIDAVTLTCPETVLPHDSAGSEESRWLYYSIIVDEAEQPDYIDIDWSCFYHLDVQIFGDNGWQKITYGDGSKPDNYGLVGPAIPGRTYCFRIGASDPELTPVGTKLDYLSFNARGITIKCHGTTPEIDCL